MASCPWPRQTSWCSLFRLFQSLWQSEHAVLLQKLCNFGITGSLLQSCESCLSNRQQRVVPHGISSSWSDVSSGVLLYSLVTFPKYMQYFLAVLLLFMPMTANVLEWMTRLMILNCFNRTWIVCISGVFGISWTLMSRNAKLWKLLRRFNHSLLVFLLENSKLEDAKDFKDLRIITNHHLSWNPHIDHVVSKVKSD